MGSNIFTNMFRKTLEHHLGKEIFPKPMDEKDEISKIRVIAAGIRGDDEYIAGNLDNKNFSSTQLDSMISALKEYNKLTGKDYQIKFEIKITSAYWLEEKVNLYLKTKQDTIIPAFLAAKTVIEGLKKYKQIMGAKQAEIL
jgi:predicted secreted hydrolase